MPRISGIAGQRDPLKFRKRFSLVSVHKWPFSTIPRLLRDRSAFNHAEGGQVGGIACAADENTPPRYAADFLELAENGTSLDRKLIRALIQPWMGISLLGIYMLPTLY